MGIERGEPFCLAQAAAESFAMSVGTMRTAQKGLIEKGFLAVERQGSQRQFASWIVRLTGRA